MTETYSSPTADDVYEDDAEGAALDREASAFLAGSETRPFASTASLRQAVRDDLGQGRAWARTRAEATREAIVDEPLKATLYAVGAGVLIGLLLRR